MAEILATLDDINANLPGRETGGTTSGYPVIVEATDENTFLIQVSVARVVRGYLTNSISGTVLMSWDSPENTPDPIREAAAKLIAAQLYFNQASRTNLTVDVRNFAQLLYDKALMLMDRYVGVVTTGGGGTEPPLFTMALEEGDFFPVDDTDRAFTMGMKL